MCCQKYESMERYNWRFCSIEGGRGRRYVCTKEKKDKFGIIPRGNGLFNVVLQGLTQYRALVVW